MTSKGLNRPVFEMCTSDDHVQMDRHRLASRRTEPSMMTDEDGGNAAQALVIKGVALVVIYLVLAQILPTPPER